MKRVYVFGGSGRQGYTVAERLSAWGHKVTCYDTVNAVPPGCDYKFCRVSTDAPLDVSFYKEKVDLVVNTLPSEAGNKVISGALDAGINIVDLSFLLDNMQKFSGATQAEGCILLHDCGLAPGLPNLLIGRELAAVEAAGGSLEYANVHVGGLPTDKNLPYGYKVTWSLEDLYEEYTRIARYVENHKIRTQHPLYSTPDTIILEGVRYEAFLSDGLRSLLTYKNRIRHLREYTLRYPGHVEAIHELIDAEGRRGFIETLRDECSKGEDFVYLRVAFPGKQYSLRVMGDQNKTAMTKTTAYSCAAMCQLLLAGNISIAPGVYSCERLAEFYPAAADFVLKTLAASANVEFSVETFEAPGHEKL
jgi:saccharopine dehydrogenase-like NADP-dependent oxidoreductase